MNWYSRHDTHISLVLFADFLLNTLPALFRGKSLRCCLDSRLNVLESFTRDASIDGNISFFVELALLAFTFAFAIRSRLGGLSNVVACFVDRIFKLVVTLSINWSDIVDRTMGPVIHPTGRIQWFCLVDEPRLPPTLACRW